MTETKIEVFKGQYYNVDAELQDSINHLIEKYEEEGFSVKDIKQSCCSSSNEIYVIITIVFTKEV